MDNLYVKGQLLQIYTKKSEIFQGRFYNVTNDKSKISLYDIKELPDGIKYDSVCHYHKSEVTKIVKLKEPDEQSYLKMTRKECEEIIKTSKKFKFINQVDNQFHESLKDMNTYSYVAVSTDGANMGRKCQLPFLVMSTPHQIYIFDIQTMEYHAFNAGLRALLEGQNPKKIVHDCRKLSDCLSHKHSVKLASVFDTQVGDVIIRKNKNGHLPKGVKSLSECLNTYLGLNPNTVEDKLEVVEYNKRPLAAEFKEKIAKNIAYLHRLSEAINDELLLPFVRGVEYFVDSIRSCDDFKAWELCGKLQQLPKDFKTVIDY